MQGIPDSKPKIEIGRDSTSRFVDVGEEISEAKTVKRSISFKCTSGEPIKGVWKGIPINKILEQYGVPPEATHMLLESADGHRACISIQTAVDGLVAFKRDGYELDAPRFVAPDIVGPRAVKNIRKIKPLKLAPHEDQEDYENYIRNR